MANPKKTVVAATTNLAALNLGSKDTRTHGEVYCWTLDGSTYFVLFHAPHWNTAKAFLENAGAVTIPHHRSPANVGPKFAAMCPVSANVLPSDTSWAALEKLASVAGVMFSPEEM